MEEHQKSLPTSSEMNKIKAAAINEVQSSMAVSNAVQKLVIKRER